MPQQSDKTLDRYFKPSPVLLHYFRKAAALSLGSAAKKSGFNKETIVAWEKGEMTPKHISLARIAVIYKVQPEDFYEADFDDLKAMGTSIIKRFLEDPDIPVTRKINPILRMLSITGTEIKIEIADDGLSENPLHQIIEGNGSKESKSKKKGK